MKTASGSIRVFISYSHDSDAHRERVLQLSDTLRENGIEAHIDRYYEERNVPSSWPQWMVRQVRQADFVLLVCTPAYCDRFEGTAPKGRGRGVRWEGRVVTQELYEEEGGASKFIPVMLTALDPKRVVPVVLRSGPYYTLAAAEALPFGRDFEKLYRRMTGQPSVTAPPTGRVRKMPVRASGIAERPRGAVSRSKQAGDRKDTPFEVAVGTTGISVEELHCRKAIDSDGKSIAEYSIKGLEVHQGSLRRLRFRFESLIGIVGEPRIVKGQSHNRRITWRSARPEVNEAESHSHIAKAHRSIDGYFVFEPPLRAGSAISLTFEVVTLNGDATDELEYYLLYASDQRRDVGDTPFRRPAEYMLRPVWWPTRRLTLEVSLPKPIDGKVHLRQFARRRPVAVSTLRKDDVFEYPAADHKGWELTEAPDDLSKKVRHNQQVARASIDYPSIGDAYSFKWCFLRSQAGSEMAEPKAAQIRHHLLRLRESGRTRGSWWLDTFFELAHEMHRELGSDDPKERFDVSIMTYDAENNLLRVVAGYRNGEVFSDRWWDLSLAPGVGTAGACLKLGNRYILYKPPGELDPTEPGYYLPVDEKNRHAVLLSVPVFDSDWFERPAPDSKPVARRHLIAVVNIGSTSRQSKLFTAAEIDSIQAKCQQMVDLIQFRSAPAESRLKGTGGTL